MDSSFRLEMLEYEVQSIGRGFCRIAGVDEAGRGPLAGPVVAGAVIIPLDIIEALRNKTNAPENKYLASIDDSKKITPARREKLFEALQADARILKGIGIAHEKRIDEINIFHAAVEAMAAAVRNLPAVPDHVLLDGRPVATFPFPHEGIVAGDAKSLSIAAASILAKVTRDRIMMEYDQKFPDYNFRSHKGYGTADHLERIRQLGPSPIHRLSFEPFRAR